MERSKLRWDADRQRNVLPLPLNLLNYPVKILAWIFVHVAFAIESCRRLDDRQRTVFAGCPAIKLLSDEEYDSYQYPHLAKFFFKLETVKERWICQHCHGACLEIKYQDVTDWDEASRSGYPRPSQTPAFSTVNLGVAVPVLQTFCAGQRNGFPCGRVRTEISLVEKKQIEILFGIYCIVCLPVLAFALSLLSIRYAFAKAPQKLKNCLGLSNKSIRQQEFTNQETGSAVRRGLQRSTVRSDFMMVYFPYLFRDGLINQDGFLVLCCAIPVDSPRVFRARLSRTESQQKRFTRHLDSWVQPDGAEGPDGPRESDCFGSLVDHQADDADSELEVGEKVGNLTFAWTLIIHVCLLTNSVSG